MNRQKGFTLVELLVVVAIIALLLGILLPALSKARETAKDVRCRAQLKGVGTGIAVFSAEHRGILPGGGYARWQGTEEWQKSWAGNEIGWGDQYGTLLPYLGVEAGGSKKTLTEDERRSMTKVYRCPSLQEGVRGSSIGSNGLFDYTQPLIFAGARLSKIPTTCHVNDPENNEMTSVSTPLIVEEDPAFYGNARKDGKLDPSHANLDKIGTWHDGGSNLVAADTSVARVTFVGLGAVCKDDWYIPYPLGGFSSLTHDNQLYYGDWGQVGIKSVRFPGPGTGGGGR